MAKKHKRKGKKMTNDKPETSKKNSQYYGHEIIRVKKARFVDGQTIGS